MHWCAVVLHDMAAAKVSFGAQHTNRVFAVATSWEKLSFEAGDRFTSPYQTHTRTRTRISHTWKYYSFNENFPVKSVVHSFHTQQPSHSINVWHRMHLKRPNDIDYTMNDYRRRWKNVQLAFSAAKANWNGVRSPCGCTMHKAHANAHIRSTNVEQKTHREREKENTSEWVGARGWQKLNCIREPEHPSIREASQK